MRGPLDDSEQARIVDEEGEDKRVPGGKVLLRLLQLTESAGLAEAGEQAMAAALEPAQVDELTTALAKVSASPTGEMVARPDEVRRMLEPGKGGEDGGAARSAPGASAQATPGEDAGTAAVAAEYAAVADQLGPPVAGQPQWRSIGPVTMPNGQTYGASRVNVSGRVSSLIVDPRNPAHVLCGAAHGGVWESFDRGGSWAPRTDYAATLTVGALAFDPGNTRTVYCGTGEGNWWSWLGNGVLRSLDGGTTWAPLATAPFVGQGFYDIAVNPANSRQLLAATSGGLWSSADGGATWTRRRTRRTWSVSFSANGARMLAGCDDGLFRSTDGTTWTAAGLPAGVPLAWNRLEARIALSDQSIAYAFGSSGGSARLYREAGGTWSAIGTPPGVQVHQDWYDWLLAVSPDNADQIYCGAIEVHRGTRSGASWAWLNLTNKGASGDSIHPDQHCVAFEPGRPNTIYIGNDGGVYRSPNRGVNFTHCNNGLVISEFEYIAQNHGSSRWLIGGLQDNGTARWQGSPVWEHVADGDGGDCGVNRTTPTTVFHTYFNMTPERSTTSGAWASWTFIPPPLPSGEGSLFYPPFEASATNGDTVAIGGDAVYLSRANGAAWVRLAFPTAARSSAMYIPNADTVFVGTTDGRIYRTRFTSGAWGALTALTTPRTSAYVSDIFVDPANQNRIWATHRTLGGGRVFRSDDGGTRWIDRTAGLPNLPVNAIEIDPANANRAWAGLDLGVWQTLDGGASWTDFSNGLPHMYIGDLLFQPHARVLRAATRSRGVWEIPVDGWMTRPQCGVQWRGTIGPKGRATWFTFNWPATWHVVWTIMPTTPTPGAGELSWTVQVERANAEFCTYWITVNNSANTNVNFEGRFCILSRY